MKWWVPFAAIGGLLAAAALVVLVLFLLREDPGAKSIEEAVEEFEGGQTGSPEAADTARRPPEGVYQLEGSGTETLSFPPLQQSDGASMPMTLEHTSTDCWNMRLDYNEAHWQDWRVCRDGDAVLESGGRTFQRWNLGATTIENTSSFDCDPEVVLVDLAGDVGETWTRSCTGTNDAVQGETVTSGTDTVVAIEPLRIGDGTADAIHVRSDQAISGEQSGATTNDFWFRVQDGLPLRGERRSTVETDSPVGTITYTEEGSWQLTSLDPEG